MYIHEMIALELQFDIYIQIILISDTVNEIRLLGMVFS